MLAFVELYKKQRVSLAASYLEFFESNAQTESRVDGAHNTISQDDSSLKSNGVDGRALGKVDFIRMCVEGSVGGIFDLRS